MITKRKIAVEVDGLISLKGLIEVYEEIAAGRMQKVRGAVVQSRDFLEGLLDVFVRVKQAYQAQPNAVEPWRQRNGRSVAVFISANSGLYGDIVDKTFEMFSEYVEKNHSDVVILGKLGLKMMADRMPNVLYNYFDFSDDSVENDSLEMVMRYLIQFEKILVFYGQFKTILTQEPMMTSVSGDSLAKQEENHAVGPGMDKKYLFEPSAKEIAKVFEGEILASLFEQTIHESQLAKFASRLLALDKAIDNIEKRLGYMKNEGRKVKHKTMSRKQLSTLSGISLWT